MKLQCWKKKIARGYYRSLCFIAVWKDHRSLWRVESFRSFAASNGAQWTIFTVLGAIFNLWPCWYKSEAAVTHHSSRRRPFMENISWSGLSRLFSATIQRFPKKTSHNQGISCRFQNYHRDKLSVSRHQNISVYMHFATHGVVSRIADPKFTFI